MAGPPRPASPHLDLAQLAALTERDLSGPIRNHLDSCPACASLFSEAIGGARTIQANPESENEPTVKRTAPAVDVQRIGRYLILGKVGEGGMGSVFAAYDPDLDRKVALKLVRFDLASGSEGAILQDRLRAEARTMARLSHPNVVQVFDVGAHGQGLYIAMEWVNGASLRDWQSKPRPWEETLSMYVDAGKGLVAAHQAGLVHRDFKPDNVLVDTHGRVRVTDFGLARLEARGEALTSPGEVLGTPGYMAAEQLRGEVLDARADQFAFAVALYEALYGQLPYGGETFAENARSVLDGQPKTPPDKTEVPRYVWPVLRRALDKDRQARFPDVATLLDALSRDPARRWRPWAGAVAGVLVLASASGWEVRRFQREAHRCADSANADVAFWNPSARAAMSKAFLAVNKPVAGDNLARVTGALDQEVKTWVSDQTAWCEAAKSRGQDRALLQAGEALQRRRETLQVATALFSAATEDDVLHAPIAIESLKADVRGTISATPAPMRADPQARDELVRANFLREDGQLAESKRHALIATQRAREAGDQASEAEGLMLQANVASPQDAVGAAEEQLKAAIRLAGSVGDDEIVAQARLGLIDIIAINPKRTRELEEAFADAQSALTRVGNPPGQLAQLLGEQAQYYAGQGDTDRARKLFNQSLVLAQQVGAKSAWVATSFSNLGVLESRAGNWKAAISNFRQALSITQEVLGPRSVEAARAMMDLATALYQTREDQEAVDLTLKGFGIYQEMEDPQSPDMAWGLGAVAAAEMKSGNLERAREHGVESLALVGRLKDIDPVTAMSAYQALGEIDLKLGRIGEAREMAERAYASAKDIDGMSTDVAEAGYLLSRALWSDAKQRGRAAALADEALKLMPKTQLDQAEVEEWAAKVHGRGTPATRRPHD